MTRSNALPRETSQTAKVVGHVELPTPDKALEPATPAEQDFLSSMAAAPWSSDSLRQEQERVLAEIHELQTENRWDDIIALFHPVEEKLAELCDSGLENEIRMKIGFSLGRAERHDEAARCLRRAVERDPESCMAHYNLAYTLLDQLFSLRTRRQAISPREKSRCIEEAHTHFRRARELRPESITFFYREGILFKEIEGKVRKAIPLFQQAVANWERLDEDSRRKQHQQRPKYVKALYHLASCHLKCGMPGRSLRILEKMIAADRDRDHMHPLFKHFAMGKVLHALGRPEEALEHLEVAAYRADRTQATDFVLELAARCALLLGQPERAAKHIDRVPSSRRRPYVQWTAADVLVAQGRRQEALRVLSRAAERDRRGRHKALLRMARIHLTAGDADKALNLSREAASFCEQTFGSESREAIFWQAASLYRLNRPAEALALITELEKCRFNYPSFNRLAQLVRQAVRKGVEPTRQKAREFSLVRPATSRNDG